MKSIGIKLADGTFYPLLEEGNPEKKTLDLTTVMDNQTKVQVDVYRTETGTIEGAEYVDTLEIKNLKPHQNGDPTLCLAIDLDENNELTAEIRDPETGKTSEIQVTLASRTRAEEEFSISDDDLTLAGLGDLVDTPEEEPAPEETPDMDEPPAEAEESAPSEIPLPDEDFNFDQVNEPSAASDDAAALAGAFSSLDLEEPAADEDTTASDSTSDLDLPDFDDLDSTGDETLADSSLDLPDLDDLNSEGEAAQDDSLDLDLPDFDDLDSTGEETLADSSLDLPDFDDTSAGESLTEETVAEDTAQDDPGNLDLPDFDDLDSTGDEALFSALDPTDTVEDDFNSTEEKEGDDPFAALTLPETDSTDSLSTDLDLPDFDSLEETSLDSGTELSLPDFDDSETTSLDLPDFDSLDDSTELPPGFDDSIENSDFEMDEKVKDPTFQPNNSIFSNLYDKETLEGGTSTYAPDEDVKKKTRGPVIICIICAIICIIAVLLTLFVVPSRLNLMGKITSFFHKDAEPAQVVEELPVLEAAVEEPEAELEPEVQIAVEKPAEEPAAVEESPAQEDAIVIAETPEAVVPVEPEPEPVKPADIRYKIVWGDTLWDISNAYYKTPWKYKRLARYNGIKNPDHIISGHWLLIPAE